ILNTKYLQHRIGEGRDTEPEAGKPETDFVFQNRKITQITKMTQSENDAVVTTKVEIFPANSTVYFHF
ncbi:hypothetical protein DD595_26520, partial [Enterobacter cloacae complex sp. 4DZ3-17B2]|uniref:hypothetical protein n=1 Tax=Enterobacter cloacae complex sp. 4DZ3-17B2 TaxID=2511990 RepID=UPI0010254BDD